MSEVPGGGCRNFYTNVTAGWKLCRISWNFVARVYFGVHFVYVLLAFADLGAYAIHEIPYGEALSDETALLALMPEESAVAASRN